MPLASLAMRKAWFWLHLVLGLLVASAVVPMALTGTLLSFERELTAWAERDLRGSEGPQRPPSELLRSAGEGVRMLEIYSEPGAPAVAYREGAPLLLDAVSGEVLGESGARATFAAIQDVHRTLALAFFGLRDLGTALTGSAALVLVLLAGTGLVLWWPSNRRALRERAWLGGARAASAAKRDWRWHHVFGIWSMAFLVLIAATGSVIAFPAMSAALGKSSRPAQPAAPADLDEAFARARALEPNWRALRIRLPPKADTWQVRIRVGDGVRPTEYAMLQIAGETQTLTRYEDGELGDKLRGWSRWVHTGQALGWLGQASWAVVVWAVPVLVYTGLRMSWRRWQRWRKRSAAS